MLVLDAVLAIGLIAFFSVPFCAATVWVYNHFLAKMHESTLKKVIALVALPGGVGLGVFCYSYYIQLHGFEQQLLFWSLMIPAGLICLTLSNAEARKGRTAESYGSYEKVDLDRNMIGWERLSFPRRAFLRLLSPVNSVSRLRVYRMRMQMPDLPPEFEGYRVAHLTDIHIHPTLRREWYERVIHEVDDLEPDVILFGGDFVSKPKWMPAIPEFMEKLSAPDGVFFVRGNHDFWKGTHRSARLAERAGMRLLSNEGVVLRRESAEMSLAGFEAPYIALTESERARMEALPRPRLGLVHDPVAFPEAARTGCFLALAGHTHGGQVRLPGLGTTVAGTEVPLEYASGVSRMGEMVTVTSHGVGAFFPLRFLCPPEVTLVELNC